MIEKMDFSTMERLARRELLEGLEVYDSKARGFLEFFSKWDYEGSAFFDQWGDRSSTTKFHLYQNPVASNADIEKNPDFPEDNRNQILWLKPFVLRETVVSEWLKKGSFDRNYVVKQFSRSVQHRSNPETKVFKKVVKDLKPIVKFPKQDVLKQRKCKKYMEKDKGKWCCTPETKYQICGCAKTVHQIDGGMVDRHLEKLPICLNKFKRVENLFLPNGRSPRIENLDSMKKLRLLDLSNQSIERIENIDHMKDLRYLFLRKNGIQSLEGLENQKKLISLDVRGRELRDVKDIEKKNKLQHLLFEPPEERDEVLGKIEEASKKIGFYYTGSRKKKDEGEEFH